MASLPSAAAATAGAAAGIAANFPATAAPAPLTPQNRNCDFRSPPIGSLNVGLFLSFAVLSDLQRVDV